MLKPINTKNLVVNVSAWLGEDIAKADTDCYNFLHLLSGLARPMIVVNNFNLVIDIINDNFCDELVYIDSVSNLSNPWWHQSVPWQENAVIHMVYPEKNNENVKLNTANQSMKGWLGVNFSTDIEHIKLENFNLICICWEESDLSQQLTKTRELLKQDKYCDREQYYLQPNQQILDDLEKMMENADNYNHS